MTTQINIIRTCDCGADLVRVDGADYCTMCDQCAECGNVLPDCVCTCPDCGRFYQVDCECSIPRDYL